MGQHERCEDGWLPPDVVIPDGTTFPEDPSTQKKYVVNAVEAAVELLLKDEASACADMSYPTDMSIPQTSDFPDFTMPRIKRTCLLSRYELRTRRRESPGGFVECVTAWRSRGQDFRFFFKETNNFKSTSGWFSRGRSERKRSKLWASSSRAGIFCFTLFCNHRSFLFFTPNGNARCSSFAYALGCLNQEGKDANSRAFERASY